MLTPRHTFLVESIQLRPIQPEDEAFLYHLFASTRADEVANYDWDESQQQAFLMMQFNAQHHYYLATFPLAHFDILELDGQSVGRLYTYQEQNDIRIIDITLLSEFRGQGIGSALLQRLQAEAESKGNSISIHVERSNPALRLYQRLGFSELQDDGMYKRMEWRS